MPREGQNVFIVDGLVANNIQQAPRYDEPIAMVKKKRMMNDFTVLSMNKKVSDLFPVRSPGEAVNSYVGVEIENETRYPFDLPPVLGWVNHREGSLRNFGFEYVSYKPVRYNYVKDHLDCLFHDLNIAKGNQKLSNSCRTSTHVHLDASYMLYGDVITFAVIYWMLEEFLSNFCGETRKGNLFCIRSSCDSLSAQSIIAQSLKRLSPFPDDLMDNEMRYGSLNFSSLAKFGSLESRLMRGVDNAEEAMIWVSILQRIKKFANNFDNPITFKNKFEKDFPAGQFPEIVLGEDLTKIVAAHTPNGFNIAQSVRQGFLSCSAIFGARPVWNFEKEYQEAKKKDEEIRAALREAEARLKKEQQDREKILRDARLRAQEYEARNQAIQNLEALAEQDDADQIVGFIGAFEEGEDL